MYVPNEPRLKDYVRLSRQRILRIVEIRRTPNSLFMPHDATDMAFAVAGSWGTLSVAGAA